MLDGPIDVMTSLITALAFVCHLTDDGSKEANGSAKNIEQLARNI
jgi:hypothetical protein